MFWGFLPETLCSRHLYLLVRLPQFHSMELEICFAKTCKLEKEELCLFLLCLNIRYMGCPKRPGQ
jgi:hypothetical protein